MLSIVIHTDNAAFDPDPIPELRRLLVEIAARLPDGMFEGQPLPVRDINGTTVGSFAVDDS